MAARSVAVVTKERAELAIATTPQQCATLDAKAAAVLEWARKQGAALHELNNLSRFRIDCMRKAGELLARTVRRGGSNRQRAGLIPHGITEDNSRRWQALARVPANVLEAFCAACARDESEITQAGFLRFHEEDAKAERRGAKRAAVADDLDSEPVVESALQSFIDRGDKFATIYADPPWQYGNQGTRAATDDHYSTMPVADICALPIALLAADEAHLHLWTTNAFLFDARTVMESWGFTYKSCFVWCKPKMGIGNYWRVSHEFMLLGVRGSLSFAGRRDEKSWREMPRGKHSAKPEKVRAIIEKVSPGPRIELFARESNDGWSSWGNQVDRGGKRLPMRVAK